MIQSIQQGLLAEGIKVPLTRPCVWFGVPRRTVYDRPTKAAPKVDPRFAEPIKAMIEQEPSFGYRTVAWLPGFNKNTVQRVFQLKGWQVRKRPIGMRPRIEAIPSVATAPNERWSTDMCRVWAGRDGWATLAVRQENGPPDRFLIFLTHRLPHTRAVGLAYVALGQSHDRRQCVGACADHVGLGTLGRVPAAFLL
ncbi:hypothetical protein, partial [Sinirhodobacter populi]